MTTPTQHSDEELDNVTNKENEMAQDENGNWVKPMTRAKFTVEERTEVTSGYRLKLRAVSGDSEENRNFFKYTPGGSIEMSVVLENVAQQFKPGKTFYVDFIEAE